MNIVEIIAKKRDGFKLSEQEIIYLLDSYLIDEVKDYQMSAFLMAVFLRGMDSEETSWFTQAMLKSGKEISFPKSDSLYVDKHSTGGVGDKVSLILAPWVACCGVKVPMLSGRGLGHTGGTLDKLASIPGYRIDLSLEEFKEGVEKIGCVISGQTSEMAPADGKIYALRDVTATVESISLICSSILSKKFAAGIDGLVFDVKCGNGAFMKDIDSAIMLAISLVGASKAMRKKAVALVTDMNQPLGRTCGNFLEVKETIGFLRGESIPDLYEVCLELAVEMLLMAGVESDRKKASFLLRNKLEDGSAFRKFQEMVDFHRGDLSVFQNESSLLSAPAIIGYKSPVDGYIQAFDTMRLGYLIVELGGGRKSKDDIIDPLVGFVCLKKIGDRIEKDETVMLIHAKNSHDASQALQKIKDLIKIGEEGISPPALVKKRVC